FLSASKAAERPCPRRTLHWARCVWTSIQPYVLRRVEANHATDPVLGPHWLVMIRRDGREHPLRRRLRQLRHRGEIAKRAELALPTTRPALAHALRGCGPTSRPCGRTGSCEPAVEIATRLREPDLDAVAAALPRS